MPLNVLTTTPEAPLVAPLDGSRAAIGQQFTTRPFSVPTRVVTRVPAGHGWTNGTDDTTVKLFTDRSIRFNSDDANKPQSPVFSTPQDWSGSIPRFWFRVADPTKLSSLGPTIRTGNGNFYGTGLTANWLANEWVTVTANRGQFSNAGGSPNWANVDQVFLGASSNTAGQGTNIWFGGIDLIPDRASTYPNGVMVCELDDGFPNQLAILAPVFAQRGIPVTFNIIVERIVNGSAGITVNDLRTLQDKYGWQIACHAYTVSGHGSLNSAAVMEREFLRQKQWLHANGLHAGPDHMALCPGTSSPIVATDPMMTALQKSFRSVRVNSGFWETANPGDALRLRSLQYNGEDNATLQYHIDKTAGPGGAFLLYFHDGLAGSTNGTSQGLAAIAANNLTATLDYAAGKGMMFRTRADFIDGR